ncbi:MAG TPA: hypothetical protein VMR76_03120 [Candidatus Saccharimonadia bacterium]|nr:hypothetical protein [Candidatus Saccharimonadia bacterium]
MNEAPYSRLATMESTAQSVIDDLPRLREIELRTLSADARMMNSQAEVELNGYEGKETLPDGTVVTKRIPSMFEKMYKLRSDGKSASEKSKIKTEVDSFEQEYRGGIDTLMSNDGMQLSQAKLFMDVIKPKYDEEYQGLDRRIEHQRQLLSKDGMSEDEAEAKAKKMYGKIEDKIEDDTRKILGLISGKGKYGVGMGVYNETELNEALSQMDKKPTPEIKEPIHTPEVKEKPTAEVKPEKTLPPLVTRRLGSIAFRAARLAQKRADRKQADYNYQVATYGERSKAKYKRPTSVPREVYKRQVRDLKRQQLDGEITYDEMHQQLKAISDVEYGEHRWMKRSKKRSERSATLAERTQKVATTIYSR